MENTNLPETVHGTEVTFRMPTIEALGRLQGMSPNFSLTMKYRKADDWARLKDKEVKGFYMGMKSVPNEDGELVTCCAIVTETECFLAGGLTLVEAVQRLAVGTPISITYLGKRPNKSSKGETMLFDVYTLQ